MSNYTKHWTSKKESNNQVSKLNESQIYNIVDVQKIQTAFGKKYILIDDDDNKYKFDYKSLFALEYLNGGYYNYEIVKNDANLIFKIPNNYGNSELKYYTYLGLFANHFLKIKKLVLEHWAQNSKRKIRYILVEENK